MSASIRPTKRVWSEDHVELARAAVHVREALRRLAPKLPPEHQQTTGNLANILSFALKARAIRHPIPTGKESR